MFSWFLKLLGIEEDKPVSSKNSFMASDADKNTDSQVDKVKEAEKTPEPSSTTEETFATKPVAMATSSEPEPEPEPAAKSLGEAFPELKANFVKVLTEAGFTTKAAIDKAEDKELLAVKGIGKATLKILRN